MADAKAWHAQDRYNKRMTKQLVIRLNTKTDADVIGRLETVDSKAGYIKRLIRADMEEDMTRYTIDNIVEPEALTHLLFVNPHFETEADEDMRDYIIVGYLDACAERKPGTCNWYWLDDAPDMGEVIEGILSAPDAPAGIREWYETH